MTVGLVLSLNWPLVFTAQEKDQSVRPRIGGIESACSGVVKRLSTELGTSIAEPLEY
jgi:hypothetical protein